MSTTALPCSLLLMLSLLATRCYPGTTARAAQAQPEGGGERPAGRLAAALPVFPGAEGFGTTTPAGRGGTILRVTTLRQEGPGSLRAALAGRGPRVIIFEVGGIIELDSDLVIAEPFVTVAGQTAPSPGISLSGASLWIRTHDVLIQHLRMRVGDGAAGPPPGVRDALRIYGDDVHDVVVDHVSASWAIDENVSTSTSGVRRDITLSNLIISEGLSHSRHPEGEHSKGILIGEGTQRLAILRSILAHHRDRSPYVKGNTTVLFANNVIYNWGTSSASFFTDTRVTSAQFGTVVGNLYLSGVDTPDGMPIRVASRVQPGSMFYLADNSFNRAPPPVDPWTLARNSAGDRVRSERPPVWTSPLTLMPVGVVEDWVLARAGARPADRDATDARIVAEVRAGAGRIVDSPPDAPMEREMTTRPLTPPSDPHGDDDGDGYTNLEAWLHALAREIEEASNRR